MYNFCGFISIFIEFNNFLNERLNFILEFINTFRMAMGCYVSILLILEILCKIEWIIFRKTGAKHSKNISEVITYFGFNKLIF